MPEVCIELPEGKEGMAIEGPLRRRGGSPVNRWPTLALLVLLLRAAAAWHLRCLEAVAGGGGDGKESLKLKR